MPSDRTVSRLRSISSIDARHLPNSAVNDNIQ